MLIIESSTFVTVYIPFWVPPPHGWLYLFLHIWNITMVLRIRTMRIVILPALVPFLPSFHLLIYPLEVTSLVHFWFIFSVFLVHKWANTCIFYCILFLLTWIVAYSRCSSTVCLFHLIYHGNHSISMKIQRGFLQSLLVDP